MLAHIKKAITISTVAAALTYASLLVPGRGMTLCGDLGTPFYCEVLAYGYPVPFLAGSQAISPTGWVGRDPLSLLIGEDDVLWPELGMTAAFWFLVVAIGAAVLRRLR